MGMAEQDKDEDKDKMFFGNQNLHIGWLIYICSQTSRSYHKPTMARRATKQTYNEQDT